MMPAYTQHNLVSLLRWVTETNARKSHNANHSHLSAYCLAVENQLQQCAQFTQHKPQSQGPDVEPLESGIVRAFSRAKESKPSLVVIDDAETLLPAGKDMYGSGWYLSVLSI